MLIVADEFSIVSVESGFVVDGYHVLVFESELVLAESCYCMML